MPINSDRGANASPYKDSSSLRRGEVEDAGAVPGAGGGQSIATVAHLALLGLREPDRFFCLLLDLARLGCILIATASSTVEQVFPMGNPL